MDSVYGTIVILNGGGEGLNLAGKKFYKKTIQQKSLAWICSATNNTCKLRLTTEKRRPLVPGERLLVKSTRLEHATTCNASIEELHVGENETIDVTRFEEIEVANDERLDVTQEATDVTQSMPRSLGSPSMDVTQMESIHSMRSFGANGSLNNVHGLVSQSFVVVVPTQDPLLTLDTAQDLSPNPNGNPHSASSIHTAEPVHVVNGNDEPSDDALKRTDLDYSFDAPLLVDNSQSSLICDPPGDAIAAKLFIQNTQEQLFDFMSFLLYYIINRKKFIEVAKKAKNDAVEMIVMKNSDDKGKMKKSKEAYVKMLIEDIELNVKKLGLLELMKEKSWNTTLKEIKAVESKKQEWSSIVAQLFGILPNHEVVNEAIAAIMAVDNSFLDDITFDYVKEKINGPTKDWTEKAKKYFEKEETMKEVIDKIYELIDTMDALYSIIKALNHRRNELHHKLSEAKEAMKLPKNSHLCANVISAEKILKRSIFMNGKESDVVKPEDLRSYDVKEFATLTPEIIELNVTSDTISNMIHFEFFKLRNAIDQALRIRF